MTLGERIKRKREDSNISQTDLAKRVGISKQTLYKYEANIVTNVPSNIIERIATILNVSPCYLMGWENREHTQKISPKIIQYYNQLNDLGKRKATERVEELTYIPQYTMELKAAHNDYIDEEGELEKVQDDLSMLKRNN